MTPFLGMDAPPLLPRALPRRASARLAAAPLLALLALLSSSPRASAGCCDAAGSGGNPSYGSNLVGTVECAGYVGLTPPGDVAGEDGCGCEEGHEPYLVTTCCDTSISVAWTKACLPGDSASSTTTYDGVVSVEDEEDELVSLSGRVLRPQSGCGPAGCGGSDARAHGGAAAARPFLDERFSLGPSSGFLRLHASAPAADLGSPAALDLVHGARPVDLVCQGTPGSPRQAFSASGLADIRAEAPGYRIDFYHTADVYPGLATNGVDEGLYVVLPGHFPHASWHVSSSDGGTHVLVFGGPAGAAPRTNAYAYAELPGAYGPVHAWTLASGGVEETLSATPGAVPGTEVVAFSRVPAGQPRTAHRAETWFAPSNGVRALLARVEDPEGLALATRWTYATNNPARPRLLFTEHPDGSWELPGYDALGRVVSLRRPLGNAWTNAPDSALSIVSNDYAAVDANDVGGWEWSDRPRTVSAYEAGVLVSRTYHACYRTAGGERVEIAERAATPTAAYGDAANLRTKRTWYAKDASEPWSEEPRFVELPGGRLETLAYESGTLDASDPDPALWSFSPSSAGSFVRATATHGTAESPDGIPGRTLRETSVRDAFGRALLEEAWACSGPSNFARLAWTATARDALGRATSVRRSDGTVSETAWSCCGPGSETGPDGIRTEYAYDALGRRVLALREGLPGVSSDRYEATAYDLHGRVLSETVSAGGLSFSTTNAYDAAGRPVWTRGPDGIETLHVHGSNSTATVRGGLTNLAVRFADGRPHYAELNGVRKATYAYGANPGGTRWTAVYDGPLGDASPVWTKTTTDFLGRTLLEERPAFGGGTLVTSNAYDAAGHLCSSAQICGENTLSRTLHTYDELGELVLTTQDLDLDGEADLAGPDRVAGQSERYVQLSGDWWRESASWTYPGDGSDAPLTNAVSRTRLTGLGVPYASPPPGTPSGSWILTSESRSLDALGNATVSRTLLDRAARRTLQCTDTPASTLDAWTLAVDGLALTNSTATGVATAHAYDAIRRRVLSETLSGGTGDRRVAQSTAYDALGRVAYTEDALANRTTYGYDALGRRTSSTDPLDQTTHTAYDAEGRVVATWGATYPVAYEYDAHGRMSAMATTRDPELDFAPLAAHLASGQSLESFASLGSLDRTQWLYHEPTGLLTNKLYADGKGTAYTYTPDGRLASRTWARGIATSYTYDASGSLTYIAYSDATPSVAFAYDRLGHMLSARTGDRQVALYAYDPATLALDSEAIIDLQSAITNVLSRSTDALGRPAGIALSNADTPTPPYSLTYGYDEYGRFSQVSNTQFQATYAYLPGSHLLSGHTLADPVSSFQFQVSRTYEPHRDLIASVENAFGATVVSRFDYANDALGRRVSRADSGTAFSNPAFERYGYNGRSEVVSGQRYHGTDPADTSQPYGGRGFGYAYDPIGNRLSASETIGGATLAKTYIANALNQYTAVANPAFVGLRGDALSNAVVTVNGNPVQRDQNATDVQPWHYALPADNAAGPAFPLAEIVAVLNPPGTNTPDSVESQSGHLYAPPRAEALSYDDDGNLVSDGRWQYTWNGENRLVKAEELASPTNRQPYVVEYAYDHRGRMVWKTVAPSNAPPSKATRYIWEDYNIVAEHVVSYSGTNIAYNVWGLDLSGSLQGAGGIGGLLSVTRSGAPVAPATFFTTFDGNANISEYCDTAGVVVAHRDYDPFGGTVVASGEDYSFSHWFSTKPWCPITGLSEYLFRKYGPRSGRWLSRDPVGEGGAWNLYGFVQNAATGGADALGECDVTPNPFPRDLVKVYFGETSDPTYKAETYFPVSLECECVCPEPSTREYGLKCTIRILTDPSAAHVRIVINEARAKQAPGGIEGRLGHEQIHVRNHFHFVNDIASAVYGCEQLKKASKPDCEAKKNDLILRYSKLRGAFVKNEVDHVNFRDPVGGQGYHPHGLIGPPRPGNAMPPAQIEPREPGLTGRTYERPTMDALCSPW